MKLQSIVRSQRLLITVMTVATLAVLMSGEGSAGIQGTGRMALAVSFGRITSTGGLTVDDVEYNVSQAQVEIDGRAGKANQLQVGQLVRVEGVLTGPARGAANQVTYTGDVVGPISQMDVPAGVFNVLGQTVKVDGTTLFGDGIQPASLAGLRVGTNVEVSAFVTASGELAASRVDLQAAGTALQIKGAVEDLDTGSMTFQINNLRVDYSQASVDGQLANASTATVWADEYPAAGTLHVTRVQVSLGLGGAAGEKGRLEGLVTSVSSGGAFYVGDQLVVTDANTHLVLHGHALTPNLAVRIQGSFNAAGGLVAKSVVSIPTTP
jgi:Domain of unknown function (DUF5666)